MNLSRIEELARKATPGVRVVNSTLDVWHCIGPGGQVAMCSSEEEAQFIAVCSPDLVLALIEVVRTAKVWDDKQQQTKCLPCKDAAIWQELVDADKRLREALSKLNLSEGESNAG